jgi:hypothetical protein
MPKQLHTRVSKDDFDLIKMLLKQHKSSKVIAEITGRGQGVITICRIPEVITYEDYKREMAKHGEKYMKKSSDEQKTLPTPKSEDSAENIKQKLDIQRNNSADHLINSLNRNTAAVEKLNEILGSKKGWKRAKDAISIFQRDADTMGEDDG